MVVDPKKKSEKNQKKVSVCGIFAAIISITATISNTVIVILVAVHWQSDFSAPRIIINKIVLIIHSHLFARSKWLSRHHKMNALKLMIYLYIFILYATGLCAWIAELELVQ